MLLPGVLLKKQFLRAIPERNSQRDAFAEFSACQKEYVPQWTQMVEVWEAEAGEPARTQPNPYELPKLGLTEKDVRLKLAEAEAADEASGVPVVSDVSPSSFVSLGMDIEDLQ